jgi:tRNA-splicing endonuclease subunit Sen54
MADASEDALRHPGANPDGPDLEDEVQDFRFLLTTAQAQKIPSRGIKDFEPHGTNLQQATLDASRDAMHMALSQTRIHTKNAQRAIYDEAENGAWVINPGGSWTKSVGRAKLKPESRIMQADSEGGDTDEERDNKDVDVACIAQDEEDELLFSSSNVKETSAKAQKDKSKKNKEPKLWLLPEEALWLIERGTLEIRWPADVGEAEDDGLPMSLQAAYAAFIGMEKVGGLTLEEYTVYQYLKRSGYIVLRAKDNYNNIPKYTETSWEWPIFTQLWKSLFSNKPSGLTRRGKTGPLVQPGLYRSYDDIYRMLTLIPSHDPKSSKDILPHSDGPNALNVTYHVYKARPGYKKTAPGPPDFYVSVINARHTSLPAEPQIDALLRQTPYHPTDPKNNLYKKLKDGYRNVILAVVDQGVTSFVDVSDSGFSQERLWGREPKPFRGGKRGGKGGGRGGRGRGRGRGT